MADFFLWQRPVPARVLPSAQAFLADLRAFDALRDLRDFDALRDLRALRDFDADFFLWQRPVPAAGLALSTGLLGLGLACLRRLARLGGLAWPTSSCGSVRYQHGSCPQHRPSWRTCEPSTPCATYARGTCEPSTPCAIYARGTCGPSTTCGTS